MATYYKHIRLVNPSNIVLKKDGNIVLSMEGEKKQNIGHWEVTFPKKEAKAKGLRQRDYVERFYSGGIPYKGQASGYSREDFKDCICSIIRKNGIDIIDQNHKDNE